MTSIPRVILTGTLLFVTTGCIAPSERDPNTDPTLIRLKSLEARVQRVEQNVGISSGADQQVTRITTVSGGSAAANRSASPELAESKSVEPPTRSEPAPLRLTAEQLRKQRLQAALAEQQDAIAKLRAEIEQRREAASRGAVAPLEAAKPLRAGSTAPTPAAPIVAPITELPIVAPFEPRTVSAPIQPAAIEMGGERDQYRAAYELLQQGDQDSAQSRFQDFISNYPNSDYADNAQYWLAESYYGQRDFDNARVEFARVEQQYPGSAKVSDAQLKIAYILYEKKQYDEARQRLETVKTRYVGSRAARLAEDRLLLMKVQGI